MEEKDESASIDTTRRGERTYELRKLREEQPLDTVETDTDEEDVSDQIETTTTGTSSALPEVERVELERVTGEDAVEGGERSVEGIATDWGGRDVRSASGSVDTESEGLGRDDDAEDTATVCRRKMSVRSCRRRIKRDVHKFSTRTR